MVVEKQPLPKFCDSFHFVSIVWIPIRYFRKGGDVSLPDTGKYTAFRIRGALLGRIRFNPHEGIIPLARAIRRNNPLPIPGPQETHRVVKSIIALAMANLDIARHWNRPASINRYERSPTPSLKGETAPKGVIDTNAGSNSIFLCSFLHALSLILIKKLVIMPAHSERQYG